jgi:hypothetical protein
MSTGPALSHKRDGDVWSFAQEINNDHPAAFPVKLIDRIVGSTNARLILEPPVHGRGVRPYTGEVFRQLPR